MPPRMTEHKGLVQAERGDQVFLPCLAHGNPPPRETWYRLSSPTAVPSSSGSASGLKSGSTFLKSGMSTPVTPSERITLLEGALVVHGARTQDSGKYTCVVNNSAGEDRADTELLVTGLSFLLWPLKNNVAS